MRTSLLLIALGILTFLSALADTKGTALLQNHIKKLTDAKSMNADFIVTSLESTYRLSVKAMKPNKVKVSASSLEYTSDGKELTTYYPAKSYFMKNASASDPSSYMVVDELMPWVPFFKTKMYDKVNATYIGMETLQKTKYNVIQYSLKNKRTIKLYIDPINGVGVHAEVNVPNMKPLLIQSKSFKLNDESINDDSFLWKAPTNTKQVTEADLISTEWYYDYEQALAKAKEQKKLVMIDFYTDWCHWCKRLDKDVFTHEKFKKAAQNFVLCKIHGEKNEMLASQFGVQGYPSIKFVDWNGYLVHEIVGYCPVDAFVQEMTTALSKRPSN